MVYISLETKSRISYIPVIAMVELKLGKKKLRAELGNLLLPVD